MVEANNPLYQDIQVNTRMLHTTTLNCGKPALSSTQQLSPPQQLKVPSTPSREQSNSDTAGVLDKKTTENTLLNSIDQGMATLTSLASEREFVIKDVATVSSLLSNYSLRSSGFKFRRMLCDSSQKHTLKSIPCWDRVVSSERFFV